MSIRPHPASEDSAVLWYCLACGHSGVIETNGKPELVHMLDPLQFAHEQQQRNMVSADHKNCERFDMVRVLAPNHWLFSLSLEWIGNSELQKWIMAREPGPPKAGG
jgi:hypothetical protein